MTDEPHEPQGSTRLHQIYESDLADLERILPEIQMALFPVMSNRLRVQLRRVKEILSNVRWDYGPPGEIMIIPAGGDSDD